MTPAITTLKKAGISYDLHRYDVAAGGDQTYGEVVAKAIGMPAERVFKTLIAELDTGELIVALVPVSGTLDLGSLAAAANVKKAAMAEPAKAERSTGYVTGGISPFGQRQKLRAFVDASVHDHDTVCVNAGRRGMQLEVAPADLVAATDAVIVDLAR